MAWTTEDRRRYAPAIQEMMRQGMLVRLAATIDAIHPPSAVGRLRGLADPGRAPGFVARRPRRSRLATAAASLAAAPDRREPSQQLATAGGAGASAAAGRGRAPPSRSWPETPADGGDHRYPERQDRPAAWAARVRRQHLSSGGPARPRA